MTPITAADWMTVLPAIALIAGALVSVLLGGPTRNPRQGPCDTASFLALGAALALAIARLYSKAPAPVGFHGTLTLDALASFLAVGIIAAAGFTLVLSGDLIRLRNLPAGEYHALVLLSAAGMILLVQSLDLVTFFIALEILSLSVYALSGFLRRDERSNEASVKYFVMGAFATGFLLYGMALLYGATGEVSFSGIARGLREGPGTLGTLGFTMIAIAVCFKVGAVPFHMWVPDVYEGAPTAITAFMSVAVKAAGFGGFLRILLTTGMPAEGSTLGHLLGAAAIATMVAGNLLAVWQRSVKRMLAYSSIAHTGYLLAGLASLSAPAAHHDAAAGTIYYLVAYTFMTLGAFAFIVYAGRGGRDAEDLEDYAGLASRRPWMALAMTVFMVSLAGIPPAAGFFGKFLIFKAAISAGQIALVVVGVLGSAVSVYYYLRVAVYMYMQPEAAPSEERPGPGVAVVVLACAVFTAVIGLLPTNFLSHSYRALDPFLNVLK